MSGTYLRSCSLLAVVLSLIATQLPAQTQEEQLKVWLKKFPAADTNKDGVLTREEAVKYRDTVLKKQQAKRKPQRVVPTHANVKYGEHDRNVFDLWLPENIESTSKDGYPLFVYFHGGGFVAGDKSGFDPSPYLEKGLAVVSANYRFVDGKETLSPTPMLDSARVIQFLRLHHKKWNLDPNRIALSGGSAGVVITLWIGYHDDLADATSDDPVLRQSTRVQCLVPINGPTNLDPHWITANMGGPKHVHGSFPKMFGAPITDNLPSEMVERIKESSPIEHVSKDDPPTLLIYGGQLEGIPLPETASTGLLIHHPYFGKVLKEKLDALKIPNDFSHKSDPRRGSGLDLTLNWLDEHLLK
ncbi:MAG: alpha/beta hydrolase [Planctomycetaceae bacterium]|nr:alpha/beta hydrolase [Planctomycetaceae bacterium]